jgi:beta-glucosidase
MPFSKGIGIKMILEAIERKKLDDNILNQKVTKILELIFKSLPALQKGFTYDNEAHHELVKKVASESIVMLKNDDHILSLTQSQRIAIISELAVCPRYQGAGISSINPTKLDSVYDCLKNPWTNFVYVQKYEKNIKTKN